jgi:hypothetical protein
MSDDLPAPEEPKPTKPSRKRRIVKWAGGAIVLAAVFVALLPTILSTSLARTVIVSWLADNVARKVDFAKLDVSWGHGVRIEGLKVSDAATPGQPLLEAPLVEIDAPLLPLLMKKLRVRNFLIENPVVRIAQKTEKETSASGAVKTRKVHRKRRPEGAGEKNAAPEPEEEDVLPEIHVPVEVRNLTVVYRDREGHEAQRAGISFKGLLDTREGPTTFDLDVPDGSDAGVRVHGAAKLFESDGTMLGDDERTVDASVVLTRVDAAKSRDFFALFVGDTAVAGILDGTIDAHVAGADVKGRADLRLSHAGYGDAANGATARPGDDLTVTGAFEWSHEKLRVVGGKVRAEGLVLDADLGGGLDSMDGHATLDADIGRLTGALHAIGVPFPGTFAGKLAGSMQFTPSPSGGSGDFTLTGFRADGFTEGRPPVVVDTTRIRFAVVPSAERFELTSLDVTLADIAATAHGTRTKDGAIDLTADAKGDLGGLLARVRDLGFLPGAFSVNGDLDAQVRVTGKPDALVVEIPRLVLAEKDARIEVSGTRAADGALDFRASGSGDLGSLFGRATAAGTQGLADVKGRFAFEATAKGPPSALAIDVPKLHVDGDISLEAHGKLAADGAIDAAVDDLSGQVTDVALLLRRMALLDRDVSLDGRLTATASVRGTREKPEIPHASLKLSGGPLLAEITGSVDAAGAVAADATMSGDLAALGDAARRAGFDALKAPLSGRLTASAKASGTRDKIAVPEFRLTIAGGAADVDVNGRYDASGSITATASVSGELDRAVALARDQGFMKRATTSGCRYTLRAAMSGTPREIDVPKAEFAMTGPLRLDVEGHADSRRNFTVGGKLDGATQTLLDLAAAWSGEEAKTVDGTVSAAFAAEGRPDRFDVRIPALAVRARSLSIDADVTRAADGSGRANAKVGGAIADILSLARAFGYGADDEATGDVDGDLSVTLAGPKVDASLALVATKLVVTKPKFGDGPFREPRLAVSVPSAKYDLDTKALDVTKSTLTLEGAEVVATLQMKDGVASLDGTLSADERFSANHAAQLSGAAFKKLAGPFSFRGDVTNGREKAAAWTGGFDLSAASVTAPHVTVEKASLPGKIDGGLLTIQPISAKVNGGDVTGKATIGLVGSSPEHHLVLDGKDITLDADLAPLVARASPLFAIGEAGKTGGKASIDLDLTANGYDSAAIKKTLKGGGTLGLADAYVESSREWVGELMKFLGSSERLTMPSVTIPFKVHDGKVETGEVPVEGAGLAMRLGGNAGLDGKLDYLMRVKTAGGGGLLAKFESLLDKEGYLPLQLGGTIAKPKLKLPDWKDAAKGALDDLLGGKKKDEPPAPKTPPKKKKPADEPPPPPPPPGEEPPPPPPPEKKEEPPPPPPPK